MSILFIKINYFLYLSSKDWKVNFLKKHFFLDRKMTEMI